MNKDPLEQIESITRETNKYMERQTRGVIARYPTLFTLLSVFGVVSVVYGFESFIDRIPFLANRPLLVFLIGVITLILTGSLYKGLRRHHH